MIYFAELVDHEDSPIKIGVSNDPYERIKQQQTGNPYIIDVVATMEGGKKEEKILHDKFKNWQCLGGTEWFYPNDELHALIKNVRESQKN